MSNPDIARADERSGTGPGYTPPGAATWTGTPDYGTPDHGTPDHGTPASVPIRVLFVCTANICRSAYAEVLARHLLGGGSGVEVASAGTYGLPAHPMNPDIAEFLPSGVRPDGFASRRVTREIVADADLILAMEAEHRRFLLDEFPASFRKVLTLGQFAEAARGSVSRGRGLVAEVAAQRPPARPSDDVTDPYRRGREANARAAAHITDLLEEVLPALARQG